MLEEELAAQSYTDDPLAANTLLDIWHTRPLRTSRAFRELDVDGVRSRYTRTMGGGSSKRSRDRFECADSNTPRTLKDRGAATVIQYRNANPNPSANDIWPEFRSASKLPAHYSLLNKDNPPPESSRTKRRVPNIGMKRVNKDKQADVAGRPNWNLPVELVEIIADYLDRDDIKSLRMVSHELNYYVSQVIFQM
jgi:hypothetical protein